MKEMRNNRAFTLIELLVVISIIAMLIAILSVGLRKVKIVATNLKQKGEFHGMDISLELFQTDFNFYPDSALIDGGSNETCGAQRLAEAMEGRDERGFHAKSKWHPDLETAAGLTLYDIATVDTSKERKPVYFELKHSGLYTPADLWGSGDTGTLEGDECPVITDVFVRNRVTTVAGDTLKVGSPVLYFKADPTKRFRSDRSNNPVTATIAGKEYLNWIYNFDDNLQILQQNWLREILEPTPTAGLDIHYKDPKDAAKDNAQFFYEILTQRQDTTTGFYKPYNKDTFILISAGWDGIFGTKDDLTNFNY